MRKRGKENPRIKAHENAARLFRLGKTKQQIEDSFVKSGFTEEEAKTETEELFQSNVKSKQRVAISHIGAGIVALISAVAVSFKVLSSVTSFVMAGLLIFGIVELIIGVKSFIKLNSEDKNETDLSGVKALVKKAQQKSK